MARVVWLKTDQNSYYVFVKSSGAIKGEFQEETYVFIKKSDILLGYLKREKGHMFTMTPKG